MPKENPVKLVSIIIPTYRRSSRLADAIDSALNQTYTEIEVIVIDDNNPRSIYREQTEKIIGKYRDDRLKYVKHSENKNGAAARNTGINHSNGTYISFLDDDDKYLPLKIEKQVHFLNEHSDKFEGVYCGRIQKGREVNESFTGDLSKQILSLEFTPTTPSLMFEREAIVNIGGFNENFKRHQDYDLLLRYFEKYTIGVVPEVLIEIGNNEGDNELHGKELEETKDYFFKQFQSHIQRIDKYSPGFEEKVYLRHYVPVFFDHLSQFNFNQALSIYLKNTRISFMKFNVLLIKYFINYIVIRFR